MNAVINSAGRFVLLIAMVVLTTMLSAPPVVAAAQDSLPVVKAARLSMAPGRARLIIDLSEPTEFAIASLADPNRIAVDLKAASIAFDKPNPPTGEGLVSGYKVAMAEPGRVRATLDLAETAQVQQAYVLQPFGDQPARLVVDLIPASPQAFATKAAADLAASRAVRKSAAGAPDTGAQQQVAAAPEAAGAAPVVSDARPLVVIDPGHGGIDSGARAPNGTMEKNIVLRFALKLQGLLAKSGRFDVALTRTDDTYLTLEDRVTLARRNRASLFVSIHADTFQDADIHGFTVYTRNASATSEMDKVLADNENHTDLVSNYTDDKTPPKVVSLLVDLMRRQTRKESYLAAEDIVGAVQPSIELRKIPVRQANFFVLQAPEVPSVLIELGFLSNRQDRDDLKQDAWQERAAQAVARGIDAYFDDVGAPQQRTAAQQ